MGAFLSSDILERQFGKTELDILQPYEDNKPRIICTKTADGTVLELSQVTLREEGVATFPDIHRRIARGKSMGKAFRESGMEPERDTHGTYVSGHIPQIIREYFGVPGQATIVDVSILVGPERVLYAEILEVYSPLVDWPSPAGEADEAITARVQAFAALLEKL